MVLLRSRGLCRVHDGFRSELRRILRITAKCIFMRYLNLENSMRRTVLHSQVIPMFSGKSALLVPLLYTIAAISVNAANAYICIICKYIFLISGHCEWWAMLRVNRKAKPPQEVGLIQPMFSQRLHHIKTQDLYFLSDSAFKEPFPKMWPWLLSTMGMSCNLYVNEKRWICKELSWGHFSW